MRALPILVLLLASGCQQSFDERFEETERDLREKAAEMDRQAAQQAAPPVTGEAEQETEETDRSEGR